MSRWKLIGAGTILAALVIGGRFLPLAHWTIRLVALVRESGGWLYVYLGSLVTTAAQLSSGSAPQTPLRTFFYSAGFIATIAAAVVSGRIAKRALAGTIPSDDAS